MDKCIAMEQVEETHLRFIKKWKGKAIFIDAEKNI